MLGSAAPVVERSSMGKGVPYSGRWAGVEVQTVLDGPVAENDQRPLPATTDHLDSEEQAAANPASKYVQYIYIGFPK